MQWRQVNYGIVVGKTKGVLVLWIALFGYIECRETEIVPRSDKSAVVVEGGC